MADTAPTIRVEVVDSVSTIAFARPGLRNPPGLRTYRELTAALCEADADDAVRCHVITGDGPAFRPVANSAATNPTTPRGTGMSCTTSSFIEGRMGLPVSA